MAVAIRLARGGSKKRPYYRVVVADSRNSRDAPDTSFYKARVSLRKTELNNVPDTFRLIPGMPLNAEIKVGSRRVIAYFMRPFLRGVGESMREP